MEADSSDWATAKAFSESWNRVGGGSVYSRDQFLDWLSPIDPKDLSGKTVLELGFGNGSLLYHMGDYAPARLVGIELGDTIEQARRNLSHFPSGMLELHRGDLTRAALGSFDLVYCIGVLHHLQDPDEGFRAVLRHTRPGGRFHCWVYAREGNGLVRYVVEPIRKVTSRLPWWLTKYGFALALVIPFFVYAKLLRRLTRGKRLGKAVLPYVPLADYSLWIAARPFRFFHHVAFDQLVTPRTTYFDRAKIETWLHYTEVDPQSVYIIFRNGNSWKFGGRKRIETR